ncbi:hypothetical protein HK096_007911, partial [Nowakowskiella sp. JEL0078]
FSAGSTFLTSRNMEFLTPLEQLETWQEAVDNLWLSIPHHYDYIYTKSFLSNSNSVLDFDTHVTPKRNSIQTVNRRSSSINSNKNTDTKFFCKYPHPSCNRALEQICHAIIRILALLDMITGFGNNLNENFRKEIWKWTTKLGWAYFERNLLNASEFYFSKSWSDFSNSSLTFLDDELARVYFEKGNRLTEENGIGTREFLRFCSLILEIDGKVDDALVRNALENDESLFANREYISTARNLAILHFRSKFDSKILEVLLNAREISHQIISKEFESPFREFDLYNHAGISADCSKVLMYFGEIQTAINFANETTTILTSNQSEIELRHSPLPQDCILEELNHHCQWTAKRILFQCQLANKSFESTLKIARQLVYEAEEFYGENSANAFESRLMLIMSIAEDPNNGNLKALTLLADTFTKGIGTCALPKLYAIFRKISKNLDTTQFLSSHPAFQRAISKFSQ